MSTSILRHLSVAARRHTFAWKYALNLGPSLAYKRPTSIRRDEAAKVLSRLNRDGIGLTSVDALLDPVVFKELVGTVARLEADAATNINASRESANVVSNLGTKTFLYELLGKEPMLDVDSIFARFALQPGVLDIVNAYFGMYTRLREYNVWRTFTTSVAPRESMLWHRDREDLLILKLFVYLEDVDDGTGPFTYAPGTHKKGPFQQTPEYFEENGVKRSTDHQMAAIVPRDHWIKAVGRKGTIVFTDTHGYHKGGNATRRERLLYTCMFTSPASESPERMKRPAAAVRSSDRAISVAVSAPRRAPWLTI